MKAFFSFEYQRVPRKHLPSTYQALLSAARQAMTAAYAPYSQFPVGAAVELEDGTLVPGTNQENAAYPAGICAERVALFAARSAHPHTPILRVAVTAHRGGRGIFPCGICRQVMWEYEARQAAPIELLCWDLDNDEIYVFREVRHLLPFAFDLQTR